MSLCLSVSLTLASEDKIVFQVIIIVEASYLLSGQSKKAMSLIFIRPLSDVVLRTKLWVSLRESVMEIIKSAHSRVMSLNKFFLGFFILKMLSL